MNCCCAWCACCCERECPCVCVYLFLQLRRKGDLFRPVVNLILTKQNNRTTPPSALTTATKGGRNKSNLFSSPSTAAIGNGFRVEHGSLSVAATEPLLAWHGSFSPMGERVLFACLMCTFLLATKLRTTPTGWVLVHGNFIIGQRAHNLRRQRGVRIKREHEKRERSTAKV